MDEQFNLLISIALLAATALGSLGVVAQVLVARKQSHLEEATSFREQTKAWAELGADWQLLLLVAYGPTAARRRGVRDESCSEYRQILGEYRDARVETQQRIDTAIDSDDLTDDFARERDKGDALVPYEASVRRVMLHLAQLCDLVVRRRVELAAIYDALGHDVLRERDAMSVVVRFSYDHFGCIAPANEEGRWWASLDLDEVSARVGWASALDSAPSTLDRIDLLMDLLTLHALKVGDAMQAETGDALASSLADPEALAYRWRVLRRWGSRPAISVTWQSVAMGMSASGWHTRFWFRPLRMLARVIRPVEIATRVWLAAVRSRRAINSRRWTGRVDMEPSAY